MEHVYIIENKDKRICKLRYSVGYCDDRMGYVYQKGIVCDEKGATFSLFDEIVGYVLRESDFEKLGVEIPESVYNTLCSLMRKELFTEVFTIVDYLYKSK